MREMVISSDEEIIASHRRGERERALKLFIETYQSRLYSLAYRMLGNHDDAMDALQEVLIQVDRSLPKFKGESSLYTWAYRLGAHICLNFRKKRDRRQSRVHQEDRVLRSVIKPVERPEEDPDKMCATTFKYYLLNQAILKLPETQRMVVVLHDMEGLHAPEIAEALGIQTRAVKSRLHRGRMALRDIIAREFKARGLKNPEPFSIEEIGCHRRYLSESL